MDHQHEWKVVYWASPKSTGLSMVACTDEDCDEIGYLLDAESSDA